MGFFPNLFKGSPATIALNFGTSGLYPMYKATAHALIPFAGQILSTAASGFRSSRTGPNAPERRLYAQQNPLYYQQPNVPYNQFGGGPVSWDSWTTSPEYSPRQDYSIRAWDQSDPVWSQTSWAEEWRNP